jgi:hypothetical protein
MLSTEDIGKMVNEHNSFLSVNRFQFQTYNCKTIQVIEEKKTLKLKFTKWQCRTFRINQFILFFGDYWQTLRYLVPSLCLSHDTRNSFSSSKNLK